jgi:hypothetical protein
MGPRLRGEAPAGGASALHTTESGSLALLERLHIFATIDDDPAWL